MNESNHYLKKIDKPLLRLTKRMQDTDLNFDCGQPVSIDFSDELKAQLLDLDKKISSESTMFRAAGWFIVIAFSLAIIAAFLCTVTPTAILSNLSSLLFMECFIWIPTFFVIVRAKGFATAVKKGNIQGYRFPIQGKWIHEYPNDSDTQRMYLVQFADAYAEAGFSYDVIRQGDSVTVYIVSYKGTPYFASWFLNPRNKA